MTQLLVNIYFLNISYFLLDLADLANSYKGILSADKNAQYDQIIDIDLSTVSTFA